MTGVRLRDTQTDELSELPADGLFVAIGHDPNTKLFLDQLEHDDAGYLLTTAALDGDEHPRRVRRRRRPGSRVPAGDHRRRLGQHGRARRGALPRGARRPRDGRRVGAEKLADRRSTLDTWPTGSTCSIPTARRWSRPSPRTLHDDVIERLLTPLVHDDEPRPRLDGRKTYVFGVLVTPTVLPEQDAVVFQEVDFVATREVVVTVRKSTDRCEPFDARPPDGRTGGDDRCGTRGHGGRIVPRGSRRARRPGRRARRRRGDRRRNGVAPPHPLPSPPPAPGAPRHRPDARGIPPRRRQARRRRGRRAAAARGGDRLRRRLRQASARGRRARPRARPARRRRATTCRRRSRTTRTRW